MVTRNQQRYQVFTFALKILLLLVSKLAFAETRFVPLNLFKLLKIIRRQLFYNQTSLPRLPLWCNALWKSGNSKCCIFKIKDAKGLKTSTKISCSVHFTLVYSSAGLENTPIDRWRQESATGDDQSQPRDFLIENGRRAPPTRLTPLGRVKIARFARIRLLRYVLPISLHILRKIPTVLQSRHTTGFTVRYLLKGARWFQRFNLPFAELGEVLTNQTLAG